MTDIYPYTSSNTTLKRHLCGSHSEFNERNATQATAAVAGTLNRKVNYVVAMHTVLEQTTDLDLWSRAFNSNSFLEEFKNGQKSAEFPQY